MTIIYLLLFIGVLTGLYYWLKFEPEYGEQYQLTFFGEPLFVIRLSGNGPWYTRLPIYFIFGPFKIKTFIFEWVDEMTYGDYLEKVEVYKTIPGYKIKPEWIPSLKEEELDEDGNPKNLATKILVLRHEPKKSLKDLEVYKVAAEFETVDNYRGFRIFSMFLNIDDLTKVISKVRRWQEAAAVKFKSEYLAWSKNDEQGITYKKLRSTTIPKLMSNLGKEKDKSFVEEINSLLTEKGLGFTISFIEGGGIILNPESRDLIDEQEKPIKAGFEQETAKIEAKTLEITETGKAKAVDIQANAEAKKIKTIGTATNQILEERIQKLKELYNYQKDLIAAKYGKDGLKDLKIYIEGNGQGANSDVQRMVDTLLGLKLHSEVEQEGGGL